MLRSDQQQRRYDRSYATVSDDYGFPDRKVADGQSLVGKQILSIGCGTCNDLWYLAQDNLVFGLDYSMQGLKVANEHRVRGVFSDLNFSPHLPFVAATFDVVVCKDILEHLLDPLSVLCEVYRLLKHNGYAIISVPNHFYAPLRLRILFGSNLIWKGIGSDHTAVYDEWNYMHIRFFTYRGFRRFLNLAGFHPEKFFWDFGNLAHYNNPDMWLEPQLWKQEQGKPISRRGKIGLYLIRPLWKIFNLLFPRSLRSAIVSLAPGLLCAGFYVRCVKE